MTESPYLGTVLAGAADPALRESLAELNEEILESHLGAFPDLRSHWLELDATRRSRLARCPFLLADAGFARPQLWASVSMGGVHESQEPRPLPANRSALSTPLLRRVLMLAWHLARAHRTAARVVLGMNSSCAALLAGSRLADLEALAERQPAWIRPRWEQRAQLWQSWIQAASQDSPRELQRLQLWGLQSLAAEIRRRAD